MERPKGADANVLRCRLPPLVNKPKFVVEAKTPIWSPWRVVLLADLFHMNIEEKDPAGALVAAGRRIGHVHFVDSNRRPAGFGHIDFAPIATALKAIGYTGYASAEALPYPDSDQAAKLTIEAYRRNFR